MPTRSPRRSVSSSRSTTRKIANAVGAATLVGAAIGAFALGGRGRQTAAFARQDTPPKTGTAVNAPSTPAPSNPSLEKGTTPAAPLPRGEHLPDAAQPNEMGRIPILMYHSVGDPPLTGRLAHFNKLGLSISAAVFRRQLEMLYAAGFYPVNMRDTLSPHLDVPRGKSPVVLTFDDARASQFRVRKDGAFDPHCAIGILAAFHQEHPADWPERATFYVLPESKYNPVPFGQRGLEKKKLQYLFDHGYEIANHSTSHRPMARMNAKTLAWEMTFCAQYFHHLVPDATMDTMAVPYGIRPAKSLLSVLLSDGTGAYHNRCILLASGDASYSPADKRLNLLGVMRIGSEPGLIERWIKVLRANRTAPMSVSLRPYISDGDPNAFSVPKSQAKYLDKNRLEGLKLVVYADPVKAKKMHGLSGTASAARSPRKI